MECKHVFVPDHQLQNYVKDILGRGESGTGTAHKDLQNKCK